MVGFVIREMDFEEMDGANATGSQPCDAIGQFVVNVGGRHHGEVKLGDRLPLETSANSLLALLGLLADSRSHSKVFF